MKNLRYAERRGGKRDALRRLTGEERRSGRGGEGTDEARGKLCKPLSFGRAWRRARAERDEADAKGRGFFPFAPAGDRAVFCKARKNALLPSKKRGGANPYFFAEQMPSEAIHCLAKKGRSGRCVREAREPSFVPTEREPEKGRKRMTGCPYLFHVGRRRKNAGLSPSHRRCGRSDASDGRDRKRGRGDNIKIGGKGGG